MRTIWITIGVLAVVLGVVVWRFVVFNNTNAKIMANRAEAISRVNKMIEKMKSEADLLQEKADNWKDRSRSMEESVERDEEENSKVWYAIKQLAKTLKAAGLPKPSEMGTMTDEQKQSKIVFADKEATAMDAYNQLVKWYSEYRQKKSFLDAKRNLIAGQNEAAENMLRRREELFVEIDKFKTQLAELESGRDIEPVDQLMYCTLLPLDSHLSLGEILEQIQNEIDELNSCSNGNKIKADEQKDPDSEISPETNYYSELDSLWD